MLIFFYMVQAEVLERAEGIKREYKELDTVWFMAGSLFQVFAYYVFLIYGVLNAAANLYQVIFVLQQYPYDIPTEAFTFGIFKQAFVAIQSCVVHLQVMFHSFRNFPSQFICPSCV